MGHKTDAKCLDCGTAFNVHHGGGFYFHLVRCEQCGAIKSIGFEELGEIHLRYLKGLPGPYCGASAEHDAHVRKHVPVEPISEEEYDREVEAFAGACDCGARFTLTAPPRCPKCRSTRIEESKPKIFYD
jgi:hypothetical protein